MGTEGEQVMSITIQFANAMVTHDTLPGHVVRPYSHNKISEEMKLV